MDMQLPHPLDSRLITMLETGDDRKTGIADVIRELRWLKERATDLDRVYAPLNSSEMLRIEGRNQAYTEAIDYLISQFGDPD
jgi:hypothetical protein